jgi:hypothetical protein
VLITFLWGAVLSTAITSPPVAGSGFWITQGVNWASGPVSAMQIDYDNMVVDVQSPDVVDAGGDAEAGPR